jgi:hypothetical protein
MTSGEKTEFFLSNYEDAIRNRALGLRAVIIKLLPGIIEQVDIPAKMVGYAYGQKYAEMICTIIPSKKGLKLGFYKGVDLPDPSGILEGTGKISRYVEIQSDKDVNSAPVKQLIKAGLAAYKERMKLADKKSA